MKTKRERTNELWEELILQQPSNEDLRYIIEYVESLRETAWQQLLKQQPSNEDLCYIIRYVESLRETAGGLLKRSKKEILNELFSL